MSQVFSIGLGISNVISERAFSRLTWLPSRHVHKTEKYIGAVHGIGKVVTSLPPEDVRKALQVSPHQAKSGLRTGATCSRFFSGILGSSDLVQIHDQSDQDFNLSPLPAHLHD